MTDRISPLHLLALRDRGPLRLVRVEPYDRLTWWLEPKPGMIGAAILRSLRADRMVDRSRNFDRGLRG